MRLSPGQQQKQQQQTESMLINTAKLHSKIVNSQQQSWLGRAVVLTIAALLLTAQLLMAQNEAFPGQPMPRHPAQVRPAVPPRQPEPDVQTGETEQETIAKCLRDLQSPNVADRRKAAMIIGKYRTPEAVQAVINCLTDEDAMVRQSALVSLTEDRMFPTEARMPVFRLLLDPDVHIRRLASALIPEASGVSIAGQLAIAGNITIRASGGRSEAETKEVLTCLNQALEDEDPSVRRNVLNGARFFPEPLDATKIAAFFADPAAEVRSLALIAYAQVYGLEQERAAQLQPLLQDPTPAVRQELARTAARLGGAGTPLLKQLVKDQDLSVQVEAVRQFASQLDPEAFPPLRAMILNQSLPADTRRTMLRLLRAYPQQAGAVYEAILLDSPPELQAEALRALSNDEQNQRGLAFFLPFLQAPAAAVQQAAATVVMRRRQELTPEQLQTLLRAKTTEAKLLTLRLSSILPKEQREELLLDSCLDADNNIRKQALQQIANFRPEGWQDILLASLADPNGDIQETAARGLARIPRATPEIIAALQEYLPKCHNNLTKQLVNNFLQRTAAQEAARQQRPAPVRPRPQPTRRNQPVAPVVPD